MFFFLAGPSFQIIQAAPHGRLVPSNGRWGGCCSGKETRATSTKRWRRPWRECLWSSNLQIFTVGFSVCSQFNQIVAEIASKCFRKDAQNQNVWCQLQSSIPRTVCKQLQIFSVQTRCLTKHHGTWTLYLVVQTGNPKNDKIGNHFLWLVPDFTPTAPYGPTDGCLSEKNRGLERN